MDLHKKIPANFLNDDYWIAFLKDIQTNIVRSHFQEESRYVFIEFLNSADISKIKEWLKSLTKLNCIANAFDHLKDFYLQKWLNSFPVNINEIQDLFEKTRLESFEDFLEYSKKELHGRDLQSIICGIFFTMKGLDFLKIPFTNPKLFEDAISKVEYKDLELMHIEPWLREDSKIHIMFQVSSNSENSVLLDNFIDNNIKNSLNEKNIAYNVLATESSKLRKSNENSEDGDFYWEEYFGFRDSISQPDFFEKISKEKMQEKWNPVENLDLAFFEQQFFPTGKTYLCTTAAYMKIDQDRGFFEENVRLVKSKMEDKLGESQKTELAEAYLLGRFKDGTPVMNSNIKKGDSPQINDFDFPNQKNEVYNTKCPYFSHIYRANQRLDEKSEIRIVRRGMPYKDGGGLHFLSFQNNIDRKFKKILIWLMGKDRPANGVTECGDPLLSDDKYEGFRYIPTRWGGKEAIRLTEMERFKNPTTIRGIAFFLVPSISFLKDLCPEE